MIAFNQIRRSARPTWSRASTGGIRFVPACYYGFSPPRKGSAVQVGPVAQRVLEWWPTSRQQALYAAIDADRLIYEHKANGHEITQLSVRFDHHYMVVLRTAGVVSITALYNELPTWGAR